MDIITVFYFSPDSCIEKREQYASSSWYHKPAILSSIAAWFDKHAPSGLLVAFVCSSKYGCKQFEPVQSKSYPVHNLDKICYKQDLDWIVPEFNDNALCR